MYEYGYLVDGSNLPAIDLPPQPLRQRLHQVMLGFAGDKWGFGHHLAVYVCWAEMEPTPSRQ